MAVQFLGSKRMTITYPFRASARLRTLGSTFSFAYDAAPLGEKSCLWPCESRRNVVTKCSEKSSAEKELVCSKNLVLMHEGQQK